MPGDKLEEYLSLEYAHSWEEVNRFYEKLFADETQKHFVDKPQQWTFRGQSNTMWGLKSTLEREIENFGIPQKEAHELERGLLRRFKRQCYHYMENTPKERDSLEWLALMRHYGAPARLLDWTYSFYVALYFAIESVGECGCAVWALNASWMRQPFEAILNDYPDALQRCRLDPAVLRPATFRKLFTHKPPIPLVGAVTPRRLNERLVIQQGVFLCPGDVSRTFEENLVELLSKSQAEPKSNFVKLVIDVDQRTKNDILLRLQRMNMNRATLFPGLEGFAQSLRTLMTKPKIFLDPGDEGI